MRVNRGKVSRRMNRWKREIGGYRRRGTIGRSVIQWIMERL
jgi:hypothetical protein